MKRACCLRILLPAAVLVACSGAGVEPVRINSFNDPFSRLTSGMPGCPAAEPPAYTEVQFEQVTHERSQRGVNC